jgi:hypothetical protein
MLSAVQRAVLFAISVAACGSSSSMPDDAAVDVNVGPDAVIHVDDGAPTRVACINPNGTEITQNFGRLDGFLVAIVPAGASNCNGDSDHVHLQVKVHGKIYDAAVNVGTQGASDAGMLTKDVWLGTTWEEGWHTGVAIDYIAMGVHSNDVPIKPSSQNASELINSLSTANHISIFGTGYGSDGVHLIHRNFGGRDGLVITDPLSAPVKARLFNFSNQTF